MRMLSGSGTGCVDLRENLLLGGCAQGPEYCKPKDKMGGKSVSWRVRITQQ